MNDSEVPDVVTETQRFAKALEAYQQHLAVSDLHASGWKHACPPRAALRRASLDLSRALSRLRDRTP